MESTASNRRIISIVFFVVAVLMVVLGIATNLGITGVLIGLAAAVVGAVFYRRGK